MSTNLDPTSRIRLASLSSPGGFFSALCLHSVYVSQAVFRSLRCHPLTCMLLKLRLTDNSNPIAPNIFSRYRVLVDSCREQRRLRPPYRSHCWTLISLLYNNLLYNFHFQSRTGDLQLQITGFSWLILKIVSFASLGGLMRVLHQRLFRGQVCSISCHRSPLKLLVRCPERDCSSTEGGDIDKS